MTGETLPEQYLTIVYRTRPGPQVERLLADAAGLSAASWSHAIDDREAALSALTQARAERDELRAALVIAEAALADIGDADREPGDDLAWCEARAAEALPTCRAALSKATQQESM